MSYERTYRRSTTSNSRLPSYYTPPFRRPHWKHSLLGYWVPVITIGTIAVGGLAAWIWSERSEDDDDDDDDDGVVDYPVEKPPRPQVVDTGVTYSTGVSQTYSGPPPPGAEPLQAQSEQQIHPYGAAGARPAYYAEASGYHESSSSQPRDGQRDDISFLERVGGAMRRTPSPQQLFSSASRQVSAGLAAAGSALGSIMEIDSNADHLELRDRSRSRHSEKGGFSDHERWSEEATEKTRIGTVTTESARRVGTVTGAKTERGKAKAKKTVAVVVSASLDASIKAEQTAYHTEHASILSHLSTQHDPSQTDLFVLIYAPWLKALPSGDYNLGCAPSALGSSYSEINTPTHTPGSERQSISPRIGVTDVNRKQFELLYNQALSLVSHPSQIMPFTTESGYVHMLRHVAPQLVYVSDTLSGRDGNIVSQLKGWVGHSILVVGDEGHGGLADTETETEDERSGKQDKRRWWEHSSLVGLGKEIDVVDAARVGDDWARHVVGRE